LLQKSKLHQFEKDGTYVQELSGEYDQSTLSQSYLVHQGKVYTTHRDGVWAGGFLVRSLPSENDPIREEEAASFSSVTGRLTAQDATLNGTTSAEKIQTASLMPENGLTPGASVKVYSPAFPLGFNNFSTESARDITLPDPPDGTTAWTGERDNLTQWIRINGAWRPATQKFEGSDIFQTLESGVSIGASSRAIINADGTALLSVSISNLANSAGSQRTEAGVLRKELWPTTAVGLPGYYTNGAVTGAITGSGAVSIRWASAAVSSTKYFSVS